MCTPPPFPLSAGELNLLSKRGAWQDLNLSLFFRFPEKIRTSEYWLWGKKATFLYVTINSSCLHVTIYSFMCQSVNLLWKLVFQNGGCVFYYFCGGHKNYFLLWFPSPFIINLESLDSYNITNFCSLLVKMVWLLNSFIVWSVSSSVFQNNVNSELHKKQPICSKDQDHYTESFWRDTWQELNRYPQKLVLDEMSVNFQVTDQ